MIVRDVHVISDGMHIVPIYVDNYNYKLKFFSLKNSKIKENQLVYIFTNCNRTYIPPNKGGNKLKTLISINSDTNTDTNTVYFKKSPFVNDTFEFKYQHQQNGGFVITTLTTRYKTGWNYILELFYSLKPIKCQVYKLSQIKDKLIKSNILLYPYENDYKQNIPKYIIQTGFKPFNELISINIYSEIWKAYNPEYKYYYFSDDNCFQYMRKVYGNKIADRWNSIRYGAVRADIFRVCIIFNIGGVYVDMGTYPYVPLKDIIKPETLLLLTRGKDSMAGSIFNAFFASVPQHNMIKILRDTILYKLLHDRLFFSSNKKLREEQVYNLFGAKLFGNVYKKCFGVLPMRSYNLDKIIMLTYNCDDSTDDNRRVIKSFNNIILEKVGFDSKYYKYYMDNVSSKYHF